MADSKITALTALTAADPANDMMPIVDVSDTSMAASGTTKRISINNILACSPTATLASATISGDLTVDTNTLKVDSANNRVGIGTTSLFGDLNIQTGSNCRLEIYSQSGGTTIENLNNARNAYLNMTMYADAYIWNRLGTEAMRLNSTGLGVGVTPAGTGGCLQLKSGITFPATQVASSDANTLDDYEEGTFTPTVTSVGGTGIVYTPDATDSGRYTKIGRLVTFQVRLAGTYTGTFSYIRVALPFTATNSNPDGAVDGYNNSTGNVLGGRTDQGSAFFVVANPQSSGNVAMYSGFITS